LLKGISPNMNILLLSGSARNPNNTLRVSLALKKIVENEHDVRLIDFRAYDIPLLAQGGFNKENISPFQAELIAGFEWAQLVVILSPEYNWSITPELLNMLQLLPNKPYDKLLDEKVFALVGTSTGKGGKVPALQLTQILNKVISFGNMNSIVSPRIFEAHFIKEVLDEDGNSLGNMQFDQGLLDFMNYSLRVSKRWTGK